MLCQEALQLTIGNHLVWSASRDTQEGVQGEFVFRSKVIDTRDLLAVNLLNINFFPCLCIIAHHGSQQTVQLQLDRYNGEKRRIVKKILEYSLRFRTG